MSAFNYIGFKIVDTYKVVQISNKVSDILDSILAKDGSKKTYSEFLHEPEVLNFISNIEVEQNGNEQVIIPCNQKRWSVNLNSMPTNTIVFYEWGLEPYEIMTVVDFEDEFHFNSEFQTVVAFPKGDKYDGIIVPPLEMFDMKDFYVDCSNLDYYKLRRDIPCYESFYQKSLEELLNSSLTINSMIVQDLEDDEKYRIYSRNEDADIMIDFMLGVQYGL